MYVFFQIVYNSIYSILNTLKSPFFWIVIGIIFFQYRKIGEMEKKILGGSKKSPFYNVLISTVFGLVGGILGSVIFTYFGTIINPEDFYFILPLAILLSMINSRFICFSYAGGIVSLISLIFGYPNVNVSGIMVVVGVLHLVESFLILVDGTKGKVPIFMERQGEIIGGFTMNRFWPVPFTIFINGSQVYPATVIAILGYGDFALVNYPENKSRETAGVLFIFSIILISLSQLSTYYHTFKYAAAIFAPLCHELIIAFSRKKEKKGSCIFTPSDHGVRILDTLPNGVGERMGLIPGNIILSINGNRIYTKKDIEDILYFRPKFIWMDIFDKKKGLTTKECKDYQKGIDSLGVIVVSSIPEYTFIIKESKSPIYRLINKFKYKKTSFKN